MENEVNIRERLAAIEQDGKSVHRRLDNLEGLVESVHIIATETKAMREDVNTLDSRVGEIESKPAKRFDSIINMILTAIISGAVGYLMAMFR